MVSTLRKKRPIVFFPKTFLKKTKTFAFEIFCSLYTFCEKNIQPPRENCNASLLFYILILIYFGEKKNILLNYVGQVQFLAVEICF